MITVGFTPVKRYLDDIARDLFAPFFEASFGSSGWELVSWDAEQGLCLTFKKGETLLLLEFEERNDLLECYLQTDHFNICARRQFEDEVSLTEEDRRFVDRVVDVVREREKRLPVFERPDTSRRTAVREILVDRLLIPEGRNHYYINPYVGCMIGCPFCYVKDRADFSRHLEGLPCLPWGRYVDVKVNAAEVLRRETRSLPPGIVRMSPILTDPYQSIERRYRITRQCLEVLLDSGFAPVVLTRAARIVEDIDLLKRFPRALVGFTIPTDEDRYRQIFEPGADPIQERLEALKICHSAGVATVALIQPILPLDVMRLTEQVAPYVHAVRIDRMYFIDQVRHLYVEHGLEQYATEAFFSEAIRRLCEAFRSRGVRIDAMDDLEPLLYR